MVTIRVTPTWTDDSSGNAEFQKTVTSSESAPTTAAHGVACKGFQKATVHLDMTAVTAFTAAIYANYAGSTTWVRSTDDNMSETDSTTDLVRVYDISGLERFAVRVLTITGTSIVRSIVLS